MEKTGIGKTGAEQVWRKKESMLYFDDVMFEMLVKCPNWKTGRHFDMAVSSSKGTSELGAHIWESLNLKPWERWKYYGGWLERVTLSALEHPTVRGWVEDWAWREANIDIERLLWSVIWRKPRGRILWAETEFWSFPALLRRCLRAGKVTFGYGSLEVVCDDNRHLDIVVGAEAKFVWLEELTRGERRASGENLLCNFLSLKGAKLEGL